MPETYEARELLWAGRSLEVRFAANWLNTGQWHIEVRCDTSLPITRTGYRSHFVPMADLAGAEAITALVLAWLDEAAERPEWQVFLQESRQLKLF